MFVWALDLHQGECGNLLISVTDKAESGCQYVRDYPSSLDFTPDQASAYGAMSQSDASEYHGLRKPWLTGMVITDMFLLPAGSICLRLTACHCTHPHSPRIRRQEAACHEGAYVTLERVCLALPAATPVSGSNTSG